MMNGKILILILIASFLTSGCKINKNIITFSDVKKGEQLDKAKEITVEEFLEIWMNNSQHLKIDLNCHELYRDERYTYFGKNELKLLKIEPHLFKVRNDSLNLMLKNYNKINGEIIRQEFWEKIIPENDKNILKNKNCSFAYSKPVFKYELKGHKIKIKLHWKIKCEGIKIFEKDYYAYYNLKTMKIEE